MIVGAVNDGLCAESSMSNLKIILWALFVSAPSMIAMAYAMQWIRGVLSSTYGIEISDDSYWPVAVFMIWVAMVLSSRRIYKELQRGSKGSS